MRHAILAALILSPVLASAQPIAQVSNSLEARLEAPKTFAAPEAAARPIAVTTATPAPLRVTTGVSAPKIISTTSISFAPYEVKEASNNHVVVSLLVKEDGTPTNVQVVKSFNQRLNDRVIAAVSQYRFHPGQLDHQAIPVSLTLDVVFQP